MADAWSDRRVLVTGATGIVGSWLVKELLARDAQVVALVLDDDPRSELRRSGDMSRIHVVNGRLESYDDLVRAVNLHEPEMVFHLGAQTLVGAAHHAPLATFEANVRGTYNLLEACRQRADVVNGLIVASSDKAYGAQKHLPYTEDMPLQGRHPYEVSKSAADLIAQSYHHTYGLPVAIARCGNVYGGGDLNWSRIVPGVIRALHRSERPVLRSDGTMVRDYIYVKDAALGYIRLAENVSRRGVAGEGFNFSPEQPLTVLQLAEAIRARMGREDLGFDVRATARGEIQDQHLSAAKARKVLGWAPKYTLEQGLDETIAWYRAFLGGASH